jgi:hypothetical protein
VQWNDFKHGGKTYDLSHLNPCTLKFERAASNDKQAVTFTVDVVFSLHCFSRRPPEGELYDGSLVYPNVSEKRLFDTYRYEMSKRLSEIIQGLPEKKVRHTNHGNYFLIEVITEDGTVVEYDIFFKVKNPSKGRVELFVETAFVREPGYNSNRPSGKPIRFLVILHNTLHGLAIRT